MNRFDSDVVTVTVSNMVWFTGDSTGPPEGGRVVETTVVTIGETTGRLPVPVVILKGGRSVKIAVVLEGRSVVRLPVPVGLLVE